MRLASNNIGATVIGVILLPTIVMAVGLFFGACAAIGSLTFGPVNQPYDSLPALTMLAISSMGCFVTGCVSWYLARVLSGMRQQIFRLHGVEYVPPITPDSLPAEEVLVRGSEQPTAAQSGVLLRAAKGQETPKDELLRADQGAPQ